MVCNRKWRVVLLSPPDNGTLIFFKSYTDLDVAESMASVTTKAVNPLSGLVNNLLWITIITRFLGFHFP